MDLLDEAERLHEEETELAKRPKWMKKLDSETRGSLEPKTVSHDDIMRDEGRSVTGDTVRDPEEEIQEKRPKGMPEDAEDEAWRIERAMVTHYGGVIVDVLGTYGTMSNRKVPLGACPGESPVNTSIGGIRAEFSKKEEHPDKSPAKRWDDPYKEGIQYNFVRKTGRRTYR